MFTGQGCTDVIRRDVISTRTETERSGEWGERGEERVDKEEAEVEEAEVVVEGEVTEGD